VEPGGITKRGRSTTCGDEQSKSIDKNHVYSATSLKNIEEIGIAAEKDSTTRKAARYKKKNSQKQDNRTGVGRSRAG
jgi:hypothetical protein